MDGWIDAGTWAAVLVIVAAAIQHTWLADWWRSRMGRSLMLAKLAIVLLLTPRLLVYVVYHRRPLPFEPVLILDLAGRWLIVAVFVQRIVAREIRRRHLTRPPRLVSAGEIPRSTQKAREGS